MNIRTGYTTGTFDDIHVAQIQFLKTCKKLMPPGSILIVGLVTDELAIRQKRLPNMNYEQRRAILQEFPFIDAVVSHTGDDKIRAWEKLGFTDLFIGDEYSHCSEYLDAKKVCTVHFVPCPLARMYSSSQLAKARTIRNAQKFSVMKDGTAGLVYLFSDKPQSVVIKTVRISQLECDGIRGANVYQLPIPPPRNMKKIGAAHIYPNIPGVNAYRELDVQDMIMSFPWCPTICVTDAYAVTQGTTHAPTVNWSHLNTDKQHSKKICFIHQRHGGVSLEDWIRKHHEETDMLRQIIRYIRTIVHEDLLALKLVHGDIHAGNICVSAVHTQKNSPVIPDGSKDAMEYKEGLDVFLIDFGWCMHASFPMCTEERAYFDTCLATHWDWTHFTDSMRYAYSQEAWFPDIESDLI